MQPSEESICQNIVLNLFDQRFNIYLIDVAIQDLTKSHSYLFENIHGAFIFYDVTKRKTFDKIESFVVDIRNNLGNKIPILILGNKNDLLHLKEVHSKELEEKAMDLNCDFMEITCTEEESSMNAIKFLVFKSYYVGLNEQKQAYLNKFLS